ncbi:hypothetical protein KCV01_g3813, partial [Aureobasidium melanogenum]
MGFLEVAGAEASRGMHACDAHEVKIGVDVRHRLDGGRADRHDGVLEEAAADQDDLHRGVFGQSDGHAGAMCHHGGDKGGGQLLHQQVGGGAAIDDNDLTGRYQAGRLSRDAQLGVGFHVESLREGRGSGRRRQGAAVHPLQQALGRQFAQVAPDRVLGHAEAIAQFDGHDLSVPLQGVEDRLLSL